MTLPGRPLRVDGVDLPDDIVLRTDSNFVYVVRDGMVVAVLTEGASRTALELAVHLASVTVGDMN